jgi:hypothetical protein
MARGPAATDPTCNQFHMVSAELALGIARDHAKALAHLERCAGCRAETGQLSAVADGLFDLAPSVEPPTGFETRVLASVGVAQTPICSSTPRRPLQVVAAVSIAVAVGVGVGFSAVTVHKTRRQPTI